MRFNYRFRNINDAMPGLFHRLLTDGDEVGSRIGPTKELAFTGITIDQPEQREILSPFRKHNLAAQIAETMWVLAGRNDVEWLSNYLPRAKDYSDNGRTWRSGYGPRIRHWEGSVDYSTGTTIDQLEYVVDLLRETPSTRQAVIEIWDPRVDTTPGKDIACNDTLHFLSRNGYLDLHVFVRSNDAMWGWSGINVFEWSTLLEMVAGMVGLDIGALHFSVSSFHLYEQHWEKAHKISQFSATSQRQGSPRFNALGLDDMESFDYMTASWFLIEAEIRRQAEEGMVGDLEQIIHEYPEPMLRSWLRVLAWWWTGDTTWMGELMGTDLYESAMVAVHPPKRKVVIAIEQMLIDRVITLHNDKNAAYGDSWCKRGEMIGIMANIARKVDRIESGKDTDDETQLDTAIDLFVYLAKYQAWLGNDGHPDLDLSNRIMRAVANRGIRGSGKQQDEVVKDIVYVFNRLEESVMQDMGHKSQLIDELLEIAWGNVLDRTK